MAKTIISSARATAAALEYGVPLLGSIPIDPEIADACDEGRVEDITGDWLAPALDVVEKVVSQKG